MCRCSALFAGLFIATVGAVTLVAIDHHKKRVEDWTIHDRNRPKPPVVTPAPVKTAALPPSDAIVLFDGKDLSKWESVKGGPAKWKVENGYFEVVAKTGDIKTKEGYGDCQLHVEWMTPDPAHGQDQDRGNSGIFPMIFYEVQVLDSFHSDTYADGQASALYGQYPPLVNASRPPGEWQTYDIIFHGPAVRRGRQTPQQCPYDSSPQRSPDPG